MKLTLVSVGVFLLAMARQVGAERPTFEANWDSLNSRKSPAWFRDAKLGIFIHWGVYSVPAYCHTSTYAEWYRWWLKTNSHGGMVRKFHEKWYGKDFKYRQFAPMWRAELWRPKQWAELFKRAGARYVVLVSKHHDGFALWPNKHASQARGFAWNTMEVGPRRDICGELSEAVRGEGLKMGFYFSFMEWDNPLYDKDKKRYVAEHMIPQIKELVTKYRPAVFWPDGEWNHPDTLWRSPEVLAWLYNNAENYDELVVNDRWGRALRGQCGDYYTTEYGRVGGGSPGLKDPNKPFEECRGIGHSFALNRLENIDAYLDRDELVQLLLEKVSRGGGLLLNLGPTADGRIPVVQQDRLVALGKWLHVNGEAVYGTRKGLFRHLPWGKSTTKGNTVFLHVFRWPADNTLEVSGLMTKVKKAYLLHDPKRHSLKLNGKGAARLEIDLLGYHPFPHASVIALECEAKPVVTSRIMPDSQGVIVLGAETAELRGSVKLESTVARGAQGAVGLGSEQQLYNVGYWSDPKSSVRWDARLCPRTTYRLSMVYGSKPGTEGGTFVVQVGSARLDGRIASHTGDWREYRPMNLGRITTGEAGDVTVTVQGKTVIRDGLMNLRRLTLAPVR